MPSCEIRAYPLAELPVPGWECFFGRNDVDFYTLVFYTWVIRSGTSTILVDTGPPPDEKNLQKLNAGCQRVDERSVFRRIDPLAAVLEKAALKPSEIDFLLITQPITYHTGCLLPEYFPRASVYVSLAGVLEFLLESPGHPPRDLYFTAESWGFLWRLIVENRLILVDSPTQVVPGVYFETTGGHHPGSAAVKVQAPGGVIGILETAFLRENVEEEIPIGVAENVSLCRNVIKNYKKECALVLAAHDNTVLDRFPGGRITV